MLLYSKEPSAEILNGFECGVQKMDSFIRESLDAFLRNDPRYTFFIAKEGQDIVAMFVISSGMFVDHDGEFDDLPFGKPWGYIGEDLKMHSGMMYPTLELDYLAVRKDFREKGYGTEIIEELARIARIKGCFFLTVDAYHDDEYSAIPFYEKRGFFALQEFSEEYDSLRMAYKV